LNEFPKRRPVLAAHDGLRRNVSEFGHSYKREFRKGSSG
jgi:hypothetical protein